MSVIKRQEYSKFGGTKEFIFANTENPPSTDRELESPGKRRNAVEADGFDGVQ